MAGETSRKAGERASKEKSFFCDSDCFNQSVLTAASALTRAARTLRHKGKSARSPWKPPGSSAHLRPGGTEDQRCQASEARPMKKLKENNRNKRRINFDEQWKFSVS